MKQRLHFSGWLGALLALSFVSSDAFAESPEQSGWRGDGSGSYEQAQPPVEWSKDSDNILWKVEIPSGYSSPVLMHMEESGAGRIFLTGEPSEVICVDAATGEVIWQQSAGYAEVLSRNEAAHIASIYEKFRQQKRDVSKEYDALRKSDPDSPKLEELKKRRQEVDQSRKEFEREYPPEKRGGARNAASTVICDGERVFAVFGTGIVAAYSVEGERLWIKRTETPQKGFGHSTSPVLAGGHLIVHIQHLIAYDPATGKERWRAEVPAKFGTPTVAQVAGQDVVITPSGSIVLAENGKVLADKQFQLSENSPLIHGGIVYAHGAGSIKALRLPESLQEPFEPTVLWETKGARDQRMASAVYHNGLLYAGGRKGIIDVVDAETGDLVYRKRLDIGELFPSLALAGNSIFVPSRNGRTLVMRPGREFEEIATNETERFSSTPAFAGRRMYLRAEGRLYCIGE